MAITFGDCSCNVAVPADLWYQVWRDICGITMCEAQRHPFMLDFDLDVCGLCDTHYLHVQITESAEHVICPDPEFWGMGSYHKHRTIDYNRWDAEIYTDTDWVTDDDDAAAWPENVYFTYRLRTITKTADHWRVEIDWGIGSVEDPYDLDHATWLDLIIWDITLTEPLTWGQLLADTIALINAQTFEQMRARGALGSYCSTGVYDSTGAISITDSGDCNPGAFVSSWLDITEGGGGYVPNYAVFAAKSIIKIGTGTPYTSPDLCILVDDYYYCIPSHTATRTNYDPSGLEAVTQWIGAPGYQYLLDGVCAP